MHYYERELTIYRLQCKYLRYKLREDKYLLIHYPSIELKYIAQEKYIETYNKAKNLNILDDDDLFEIMIQNKLWSLREEKDLTENLPKEIENLKYSIYKSHMNKEVVLSLKEQLKNIETKILYLHNKRHCMDYVTCHGIATYYRLNFLVENSTKFTNGKLYKWKDIDLSSIVTYWNSNILGDDTLRELAKTEPWQSIWYSAKRNNSCVFDGELSDDQRRLVSWSHLYDNVRESSECPHESVIEDDDMMDGWLISQRRNREKNQTESSIGKNLNSKIAGSQDIFIVANDPTMGLSIEQIEKLNSPQSAMIKKQRVQTTQKLGEASPGQFLDVQLDLQQKQNEAYMNKMRGRNG
jgi:hypothetical protein